jgi:hypothetical protein
MTGAPGISTPWLNTPPLEAMLAVLLDTVVTMDIEEI